MVNKPGGKRRVEPSTRVDDYIPPHDYAAECAVLGCVLLSPEGADLVLSKVDSEDFYSEVNQYVFNAAKSVHDRGQIVEFISLERELVETGTIFAVGGAGYLAELYESVSCVGYAPHYIQMVLELSEKRKIGNAGMRLIGLARHTGNSAAETWSEAEKIAVEGKGRALPDARSRDIGDVLTDAVEDLDERIEEPGKLRGMSSGFPKIDAMTGGFRPGQFVIVAGASSMGKTALATAISEHVAIAAKKSVLLFSLEMSTREMVERIVCSRAEIRSQAFGSGMLSEQEYSRFARDYDNVSGAKLAICDTPGLTVAQIKMECKRIRADRGLDLVVVDYLQLMGSDQRAENRTQEVSAFARDLKTLARDLNVPVVALSQLSRAVNMRPDKKPVMSDLRESGGIEAEADIVLMLYREAYYDRKEEYHDNSAAYAEDALVIVAKNRNGPTGYVHVAFVPQYARYMPREVATGQDFDVE